MTYYADTAYDSTNLLDLPPKGNLSISAGCKDLRRYPLKHPKGIHCGEFLTFSNPDIVEVLQTPEDFPDAQREIATTPLQEQYTWDSLKNPKVVIATITTLAGFALVVGGTGVTLTTLYDYGLKGLLFKELWFILGPLLIGYSGGKFILRFNLVKDKNNIILNRRTGLVSANHKGKRVEIPFAELDPYRSFKVNPSGTQDNQFRLGHRLSEANMPSLQYHYELYEVYQDWEIWQQYMDITKPLPDIPEFEPFRHKDPVSAEFDKKHNRPKDYWKNFDLDEFNKVKKASMQAAESFPWGSTLEQALASGWQPSGFGQGDWLKQ